MARREGLRAMDLKVVQSEKSHVSHRPFSAMDVPKPTAEVIPEIIGIVFEYRVHYRLSNAEDFFWLTISFRQKGYYCKH